MNGYCHVSAQTDQHAHKQGEQDRLEAEQEQALHELFDEAEHALTEAASNARKAISNYRVLTVSADLFAALAILIQEMPEHFEPAIKLVIERNLKQRDEA